VNYINGIKSDNSLENIEWVNHKGNMVHAHEHGLFKTLEKYNKKVKDTCTGEVFETAKKLQGTGGMGTVLLKIT
jgi:hypothetical protein